MPSSEIYDDALAPNIEAFCDEVRPKDVVIVHDPQPAGLIPKLKSELGVPVIWRCHVGIDIPSDRRAGPGASSSPYVEQADAFVFSRQAFAWEGLDDDQHRADRARRSTPSRPRTRSWTPRRRGDPGGGGAQLG